MLVLKLGATVVEPISTCMSLDAGVYHAISGCVPVDGCSPSSSSPPFFGIAQVDRLTLLAVVVAGVRVGGFGAGLGLRVHVFDPGLAEETASC